MKQSTKCNAVAWRKCDVRAGRWQATPANLARHAQRGRGSAGMLPQRPAACLPLLALS